MPYYFRKYRAGFFHSIPESFEADVLIVAPAVRARIHEEVTAEFTLETGGLRPSVLRAVYIDRELWERYMETRR